jgi:Ca2+-binding EF-hand superfamily protein
MQPGADHWRRVIEPVVLNESRKGGVLKLHHSSIRNYIMKANRSLALWIAAGALGLGVLAVQSSASAAASSALSTLDPDKDGTVDLAEAKAAAATLFTQLDHDNDGTLDRRELRGRVTAKQFAAADPDRDGTLDKNECMTIVEQRFKAADPDNDGTLDSKELKSPAGRSLLRLLVK